MIFVANQVAAGPRATRLSNQSGCIERARHQGPAAIPDIIASSSLITGGRPFFQLSPGSHGDGMAEIESTHSLPKGDAVTGATA
jgi:hypothetical protein